MFIKRFSAVAVAILASASTASAQDTEINWLFIVDAQSMSFDGTTLSLEAVGAQALAFSDRPHRFAAQVPTADFLALWSGGAYADDPPNAGVNGVVDGRPVNAVVELTSPRLDGTTLSFSAAVVGGTVPAAASDIALFVDAFPTAVNSQITDAVPQSNVEPSGDAPATAVDNLYQTLAEARGEAAGAQ